MRTVRSSASTFTRLDGSRHWVRASIGTVGDAYDHALGKSFVDRFKTELIADRVWRSRAQLDLAKTAPRADDQPALVAGLSDE